MELNNIIFAVAVVVIAFLVGKLILSFFVFRVIVKAVKLDTERQSKLQEMHKKREIEKNKARIRALFKFGRKEAGENETDTETDIPARRN